MFDVNPDAAKYYLKDIERQVAAARQPRSVPYRPARRTTPEVSPGNLSAVRGRVPVRLFASAVRGVLAAIF